MFKSVKWIFLTWKIPGSLPGSFMAEGVDPTKLDPIQVCINLVPRDGDGLKTSKKTTIRWWITKVCLAGRNVWCQNLSFDSTFLDGSWTVLEMLHPQNMPKDDLVKVWGWWTRDPMMDVTQFWVQRCPLTWMSWMCFCLKQRISYILFLYSSVLVSDRLSFSSFMKIFHVLHVFNRFRFRLSNLDVNTFVFGWSLGSVANFEHSQLSRM